MTRTSRGRHRAPRSRRRLTAPSALVVLTVVTSIGAGLGTTAWADNDPNVQKSTVDSQLAAANSTLEGASVHTEQVRAAYAAVVARVDAATTAQATAAGRLAAARSEQAAAAVNLAAARAALVQAQADVVTAEQAFDDRAAQVVDFARAAYETGPTANMGAVLAATDIQDLADREITLRNAGTDARTQVAALSVLHAVVAGKQAAALVQQGQVQAALSAASDAVGRAQAASDDAAAAATTLAQAKADQAAQVGAAEQAQATDQAAADELQNESDSLAALLKARAAAEAKAAAAAAASAAAAAKVPVKSTTKAPTTTAPAPVVVATQAPSSSGLLWPTPGPITSPFGYRISPITGKGEGHAGVDIGAPLGQTIVAAQAGTVVYAGVETGYGNYTCIDHGGGLATCYAHQSLIEVSVGQVVARGQEIGKVGSTGNSTGPHLHFETRVDGTPVDPMQYF